MVVLSFISLHKGSVFLLGLQAKEARITINKPYESLEFTDDFLFSKILFSDPDLARRMLEIILDIKIRDIKTVVSERSLRFTPYDHGVRFDVYVKDTADTVYEIEMQTSNYSDLAKRTRYYHSMITLDQLEEGTSYSELKKSYVIFICKQKPFRNWPDLPIYTFNMKCEQTPEATINDGQATVFVNAESTSKAASAKLKHLLSGDRKKIISPVFLTTP